MNNPDTELIFPWRVVPLIADTIDMNWKEFVGFIISNDADALDKLGFVLTMARLAGCVSCNSDSFRAIRGCSQCALQTIKRQHLNGSELRDLFEQNRLEVENYSKNLSGDGSQLETIGAERASSKRE